MDRSALSRLPSVDEVLSRPATRRLLDVFPRPAVVRAVRAAVERVRRALLDGGEDPEVHDDAVALELALARRPGVRPVLNATGVILHTNLGRAPLADVALEAITRVARGYSSLELDLETGERGSRFASLSPLLAEITGAEAGMVVNNGASALWLTLAALARGRTVIVSRGELVEIGGGFRVPDVMRESGARLVEVGTTNRTRLEDYAAAIDDDTALLVKVHRSNFALVGFTEEVSVEALARLGAERGLPVVFDQGSGCLTDLTRLGLPAEPTVPDAVAAGASVVTFSGDKLLGGPQAGVLVGRRELLRRIERHPLARALRVDKLTVAALEATLRLHRDGRAEEVPVMRMLQEGMSTLEPRARRLLDRLLEHGVEGELVRSTSQVGGGSIPTAAPPSHAVAIGGVDPEALHAQLRAGDPAVVARVQDDRLLLDARALEDADLAPLAAAVAGAVSRCRGVRLESGTMQGTEDKEIGGGEPR
jgi:L-seryl-tRNA(Ser) seleniumtransferase